MPTDARTVRALLGDLTRAAADLGRTLDQADAVQWQTSPVPKPREDTVERSKGAPPSDPTADAVIDERRLALRGAVEEGARSLRVAHSLILGAYDRLDDRLGAWEGR